MMEMLYICIGLLITILTFWDFFYSLVSGNGLGFISGFTHKFLARIILKAESRRLFHYSGFIHITINILVLFILLLLGSFLVFMGNEKMVVHEDTLIPASPLQRFYYICYLLSTAGFGKFVPGNGLSEFFSSIYSFMGFILLTTAMAYLISVVNSVLLKKELALYISSLGKNIDGLYHYFTVRKDLKLLVSERGYIRQMLNKNSSNLNTFPVISFFMGRRPRYALILQMARLYEVLIFLRYKNESKEDHFIINSILNAIENYLIQEENSSLNYTCDKNQLLELRKFWKEYSDDYPEEASFDDQMYNALRKAGWTWEDVYENKIIENRS